MYEVICFLPDPLLEGAAKLHVFLWQEPLLEGAATLHWVSQPGASWPSQVHIRTRQGTDATCLANRAL